MPEHHNPHRGQPLTEDEIQQLVIRCIENALNGNRHKVKLRFHAWYINLGIWLFGVVCGTLVWVWSGKVDLEILSARERTLEQRLQALSQRVWTDTQQYVYSGRLEALNSQLTPKLITPNIDEIRAQFPNLSQNP